MRQYFIAASLIALVSATGAAAQVSNQSQQGSMAQKNMRQPSPAEWARMREARRLGDAAQAALNAGAFLTAETDARQAIVEGERSGYSNETLASALYSQGKDREALQVYKKMAEIGGGFPRNLLPYALLSLKAGHWAQATAAYDKALTSLGFGDLMRRQGEFSPDVPQPTALEAAIHVGMGLTMDGGDFHGDYQARNQQALAHLRQALALEPNSALTNYYYGFGLRRLNRRSEAKVAFQKAATLDHDGPVKAAAERDLLRRY